MPFQFTPPPENFTKSTQVVSFPARAASSGEAGHTSPEPVVTNKKSDLVTVTIDRKRVDDTYFVPQSALSTSRNVGAASQRVPSGSAAGRILRSQLSKPVLQNLERLQEVAGSFQCTTPASGVMQAIINFRNALPNDPLTDTLIALFDAMVDHDRWSEYTAEQYYQAYQIISRLLKEKELNHKSVENSINSLDKAGFGVSFRSEDFAVWSGWDEDGAEEEGAD